MARVSSHGFERAKMLAGPAGQNSFAEGCRRTRGLLLNTHRLGYYPGFQKSNGISKPSISEM
jgi:hypothetical protein